MSDEKEVKKTSIRSKHSSSSITNYVFVPLIYATIALVVIVPLMVVGFGVISDYANNIASSNKVNNYDNTVVGIQAPLSDETSGNVSFSSIKNFEEYGKILCEKAGINCSLYNGINNSTLRCGAGSQNGFVGTDNASWIYGYNTTVFKNLDALSENDIVTIQTTYGKYTYQVTQVVVSDSYNAELSSDDLVLYCSNGDNLFANQSNSNLYVIAKQIAGPQAVEVSK